MNASRLGTRDVPINMLWIGPVLGGLERACIRSVLRQGHRLKLWCYRFPEGVPEGVEVRDAAEILPESSIIRHRTGSVSLFSNWFRYELQRQGEGTWLDTDVYLLRPLPSDTPYLLTEYEDGRINGGALRLPSDSPALPLLLALFEETTVPYWLPYRAQLAAHWRLAITGRSDLSRMPWGVAGPNALTAICRKLGLSELALAPEVCSPTRWQDADWILDPAQPLERWTTPRTAAVHLWNERIKGFKNEPAPPGSFLARLQSEGAA